MPGVLAAALVFVTSGAVLVLEILAGRLLAPYVGVTLETFTGIIGVVLAGIAVGTWLGGRVADRYDPHRLLPATLTLGGGLAILSVPLIRSLGEGVGGSGPLEIVVLATVGFFLPSAVLSAASPLVVKIQLTDLALTGHVVGRLSAIGTAGSLVGVFATGFVLIAAFPTTPVIVAVGGALAIAGVALWWYLGRATGPNPHGAPGEDRAAVPSRRWSGTAMMSGLVLAVSASALAVVVPEPCEVESAYFCARIEVDEERPTGRTLVLDTLSHSYVDLDDPTHLEFAYVRILGDLIDLAPSGRLDVVHVGGGGFTLPRYVDTVRPGSDNVVFELDPTLIHLAEDELGLVRTERLRVRSGDARTNLRRLPASSTDIVIGDAFGGLAVPWHLTTREFLIDIERVLRDDGFYAVNVIDGGALGFARAQAATLLDVFEHVAIVATRERIAGERGGNFVLVASERAIPVDALEARIRARGGSERVATGAEVVAFAAGARVLTDDHAPVDQLLTRPR